MRKLPTVAGYRLILLFVRIIFKPYQAKVCFFCLKKSDIFFKESMGMVKED